jgi:Ca-activated chloride channel family protein
VTAETAQRLILALGAGQIVLPTLALPAGGGASEQLSDAVLAVQRIDPGSENTVFQRGLEPDITVLPGNYVLSLTLGSVRLERTVGVRAGEASAFDAGLMLGAAELDAVAAAGGARTEGAILALFQDDPDAPQGRREVWRSASNPATAILPAGNYYAVARKGSVEARDRIAIRPGEVERRSLVIEAARLTVATSLAGNRLAISEPVSHRLERLDGDHQVTVLSNANASFRVAAGRYRLETRVGLGNAVAARDLELRPGAQDQLSLDLPAGQLRLRWLDPGGAPAADVAWEVRDASGRAVWAANQTEGRPLLLAGRYALRAEVRDRRVEQMVDVRAGEVRSIDITPP